MTEPATAAHRWAFDGDDPYIVCGACGEYRDAVTGTVIVPGQATSPCKQAEVQRA